MHQVLHLVGPGASERISLSPPMPSRGRMATVSTTMPMPPSQWMSERQNSTGVGQALDVRQNRGAGGGEAGDGLEKGVRVARNGAANHERQGAERRAHQPAQHHHQKPVAGQQAGIAMAAERQEAAPSNQQGDHHRRHESAHRFGLVVDPCHHDAADHEHPGDQQQRRDGIQDQAGTGAPVDGGVVRRGGRGGPRHGPVSNISSTRVIDSVFATMVSLSPSRRV